MNCFLAYEYDTPLVSCIEACKFYCSANYVNCGEHVQQVVIVCPCILACLDLTEQGGGTPRIKLAHTREGDTKG